MSDTPCTSKSLITRSSVEALNTIDLIGRTSNQITGSKLPSNRQVLQLFFHNMRIVKLSSTESAKLSINATLSYWQQARIPTKYEAHCIKKLNQLYDAWKNIQRKVPEKRSGSAKKQEEDFVAALDDLFDISHANAMEMINIAEDRDFLTMQRQKGRPGCMAGVDRALYEKEQRRAERLEKELNRKRTHDEMMQKKQCKAIYLDSASIFE